MSENSQDKPFKTLKLTSMRSADTAKSAAVAPEADPVAKVLARPEPIVMPAAEVASPAAGEPACPAPSKAAAPPPGGPAKDAPNPASFNLVNFKVGGTKKKEPSTEAPTVMPGVDPVPVEAPADSPAPTPPPALSPSAATSGPAGLKPFKFLVQPMKPEDPGEDGAHRPQEIKLSRAVSAGLGSAESTPPTVGAAADEAARPGAFALKQSSPPVKAEVSPVAVAAPHPRAPVAKPSAKPLVLILAAAVALVVIGGGVMIFLSREKPAVPVRPVEVTPVTPAIPVEPVEVVTPVPAPLPPQPVIPPPVVSAPRTSNPGLESWLAGAKVTIVAAQRVTMNDRIYSLGATVNPEGTLRWIGRDSKTKDLLFIDDNGVIYSRHAGGR